MASSRKQLYNMDEILEYIIDSDGKMEWNLESDFRSEDDFKVNE